VTCGDKLDDMANELGPDEYIEEFVWRPKTYAYRIVNARTLEKKTVQSARNNTQLRRGSGSQLCQ